MCFYNSTVENEISKLWRNFLLFKMMYLLSVFLLLLPYFNVASEGSTCVCTTVPCPVVGKNYLTFGGGGSATYNYEAHGSYIVVVSATATISNADLNKGTDTTSCTQQYSRNLDDDGVQVVFILL